MTKDPRVYLAHILECIQRIERFTAGGKKRFLSDVMMQDAVLRNFEVIGEAAKRLSEEFKNQHPAIPWRKITGLRDVLIHRYMEADTSEVWQAATHDIKELKAALESSV